MDQPRAAISAIAILTPLAVIAPAQTDRLAQQDREEQKNMTVIASFYPLYEFTSRVIGDRAEASSLIPAGIEPHDGKPTAEDISRGHSIRVLVINGACFERWADDMKAKVIANTSEGIEFDYKEEQAAGDDEHGHGGPAAVTAGVNAHLWLDPMLAKHQIDNIHNMIAKSGPVNADYYNQNADRFSGQIDSLDPFIRSELAGCDKSDFIAFHDAFSYLSERYGGGQHSIHRVSPEDEILPQTIQQIIELANELDINVIYSEDLIDSRLADTIANEIPNGKVLILSPIEGMDKGEQAAGIGYIDKMKQNIANLKDGLECR